MVTCCCLAKFNCCLYFVAVFEGDGVEHEQEYRKIHDEFRNLVRLLEINSSNFLISFQNVKVIIVQIL